MRTLLLPLIVALAAACTCATASAQSFIGIEKAGSAWELEKDRDNIKGFTRRVEGEPLKEFKVLSETDAPFDSITAFLKNSASWSTIFSPYFYNVKLVESRPDGNFVQYVYGRTPLFIKERDLVLEFTFQQAGSRFLLKITGRPDLLPEKEGYIRVPRFESLWVLSPQPNGTTEIVMIGAASAGGEIPDAFANRVMIDAPVTYMENLLKHLANIAK